MRFLDKNGDLHRFYIGSLIMPTVNKIKKSPTATKMKQTVKAVTPKFMQVHKTDGSFYEHYYAEDEVIDVESDDVDGI